MTSTKQMTCTVNTHIKLLEMSTEDQCIALRCKQTVKINMMALVVRMHFTILFEF